MEVATKIKLTVKEERFVASGLPPTRAAKVAKGTYPRLPDGTVDAEECQKYFPKQEVQSAA